MQPSELFVGFYSPLEKSIGDPADGRILCGQIVSLRSQSYESQFVADVVSGSGPLVMRQATYFAEDCGDGGERAEIEVNGWSRFPSWGMDASAHCTGTNFERLLSASFDRGVNGSCTCRERKAMIT